MPLALGTAAFGLVLAGYVLRWRRAPHVVCMLAAGAIDLGVVLFLELTRDAVATAASTPGPLMAVHVSTSVAALLGYAVLAPLGWAAVRGRPHLLPIHRWGGRAFLLARSVSFATSWFVS